MTTFTYSQTPRYLIHEPTTGRRYWSDDPERKQVQSPSISPSESWRCKARGSVGANDPQDCDWPVCGCDPYADKVIAALEEKGALLPPGPATDDARRTGIDWQGHKPWCNAIDAAGHEACNCGPTGDQS